MIHVLQCLGGCDPDLIGSMVIFYSGRVVIGSVRRTSSLGTLDIGGLLVDTDYTQVPFRRTMHEMRYVLRSRMVTYVHQVSSICSFGKRTVA